VPSTALPDRPPGGRAAVVYTALRLALFGACVVVGWVAGLRGLALVLVALLVSGVLSWFSLTRQRVAMGMAAESVLGRLRERQRRRTEAEDAYVDRVIAEQERIVRPDR